MSEVKHFTLSEVMTIRSKSQIGHMAPTKVNVTLRATSFKANEPTLNFMLKHDLKGRECNKADKNMNVRRFADTKFRIGPRRNEL